MKYVDLCLAMAGLASPLVLAVAAILVSAQRPEYSHLRNTLSELGMVGAPGATWMNVTGILPAGILVGVAALGVHRAFGEGKLSLTGSLLLGLGGTCLGASALSPWRGSPMDFTILTNRFHVVFAVLGFLCLSSGPLLLGLHARGYAALHTWFLPSVCASLCIFVLGFWPRQGDYRGALQRGSLLAFFGWLAAVCLWVMVRRIRSWGP